MILRHKFSRPMEQSQLVGIPKLTRQEHKPDMPLVAFPTSCVSPTVTEKIASKVFIGLYTYWYQLYLYQSTGEYEG